MLIHPHSRTYGQKQATLYVFISGDLWDTQLAPARGITGLNRTVIVSLSLLYERVFVTSLALFNYRVATISLGFASSHNDPAWQPPIHPTIRRPTSQTDPEHTNSRQVSSTHTIYSSWPTHASPVCRYCVARTKHRVPVIANVFFYAQIRQYYFACMFILFFSLSRSIPVPGLFFCGDNVCFRVRHILVRVNMRLTWTTTAIPTITKIYELDEWIFSFVCLFVCLLAACMTLIEWQTHITVPEKS